MEGGSRRQRRGKKRSFVYTLGGVSTVVVMSFGLCFGSMDSVVDGFACSYTL